MGSRHSFFDAMWDRGRPRPPRRGRPANCRRRLLAERLEARHLLTTIDLALLTSDQGSVMYGPSQQDRSGVSVSIAGDVNGDGFDDLLIGAPGGDGLGHSVPNGGETYLIFGGPALPTTISLAALGSLGITIYGVDEDDDSGGTVSAAGDVNGDGFDDLFIAASFADAAANVKDGAGESYLILGGDSLPATIDLAAGGANVAIFGADPDDGATRFNVASLSVANAGDVNGDGYDELLIGAGFADGAGNAKVRSGESYLIFGGPACPAPLISAHSAAPALPFTARVPVRPVVIRSAVAGTSMGMVLPTC